MARSNRTRACERCGKEFFLPRGKNPTQRFCSLACRQVPRDPSLAKHQLRAVKVCKRCGKEFHPNNGQYDKQQYCSLMCYDIARQAPKVLLGIPRNRTIATKACEWCGKDFHPIIGRTQTQRFCSLACRDAGVTTFARTMSEAETAWLAAILDGEGNLQTNARSKQDGREVRITITNTSVPLIERITELTGVGYVAKTEYDNPNWQTRYNWILSGGAAVALLRQMLPWLIVKREKALVALGEPPDA